MKRKHTAKKQPDTRSTHAFVGTWVQEADSIDRTAAVFTIAVKEGRFLISGVDESDGTVFKLTNIRWDGETLRFVTFFPPTNHKAKHALRLIGRGRVSHKVTYSDETGTYASDERWRKRAHGQKHSQR
jgi:hypothetical protein